MRTKNSKIIKKEMRTKGSSRQTRNSSGNFLPGKFHGKRSLAMRSQRSDMTEQLSTHVSS